MLHIPQPALRTLTRYSHTENRNMFSMYEYVASSRGLSLVKLTQARISRKWIFYRRPPRVFTVYNPHVFVLDTRRINYTFADCVSTPANQTCSAEKRLKSKARSHTALVSIYKFAYLLQQRLREGILTGRETVAAAYQVKQINFIYSQSNCL